MRRKPHVRFGGRAEETDQPKRWHRASVRSNHTTATVGLAAGVPTKIMSTRLGHATKRGCAELLHNHNSSHHHLGREERQQGRPLATASSRQERVDKPCVFDRVHWLRRALQLASGPARQLAHRRTRASKVLAKRIRASCSTSSVSTSDPRTRVAIAASRDRSASKAVKSMSTPS